MIRLSGLVPALVLPALFAAPALGAPGDYQPDHADIAKRAVEGVILPGYQRFHDAAAALESEAQNCDEERTAAAYHSAFDAWMGVSYLNFGPAEAEGRMLAIAYWPDDEGRTPRALGELIATEDPVVDDAAAFAGVTVAARGLFALDYLLFDETMSGEGTPAYRCRLTVAIARDLSRISGEILAEWKGGYGALMETAGAEGNLAYLTPEESTQALYNAAIGALDATLNLRMERTGWNSRTPQPLRAEAWRSGRSLRNIGLSLAAMKELYETAFSPYVDELTDMLTRENLDQAIRAARSVQPPLTETILDPEQRPAVMAMVGAAYALQMRSFHFLRLPLQIGRGFSTLDGN